MKWCGGSWSRHIGEAFGHDFQPRLSGEHALWSPGAGPPAEIAERFDLGSVAVRSGAPAEGHQGLRWSATDVLRRRVTTAPRVDVVGIAASLSIRGSAVAVEANGVAAGPNIVTLR